MLRNNIEKIQDWIKSFDTIRGKLEKCKLISNTVFHLEIDSYDSLDDSLDES